MTTGPATSLPFCYSVERTFPHLVESLWQAWTEAEALEQWYSPTDLRVVPGTVVSDARPGGLWTVAVDVSAHGFNAYFFGTYTEVQPLQRLAHTLSYTQSAVEFADRDPQAPHHDIVIDFEQRGTGTWVRFAQYGVLPEGQAPQAQAGMESYFDNLAAYLQR